MKNGISRIDQEVGVRGIPERKSKNRILELQYLEGENIFMRLLFFTPQKVKLRPGVYT